MDATEAANAEQAVLDAAFDRARAKLIDAHGEAEQSRAAYPGISRTIPVFRWAAALVFFVGLPLWIWLLVPDLVSPDIWLEKPLFPFSVVVAVGMAALMLRSVLRRGRMSAAERMIRHFYDAAGWESNRPIQHLSEFVIGADFDAAPRKAPAINPGAEPAQLSDGGALDKYWTELIRPSRKLRHQFTVDSVELSELDPGLQLASVKLRVVRVRKLPYELSVLVLIIPYCFESELNAISSWLYFLLIVGAALAMVALLHLFSRATRTFRVHKLVVRCGNQWRLFCGDWEGWEERDLSWLDAEGLPLASAPRST
jgi:hypothetical protein